MNKRRLGFALCAGFIVALTIGLILRRGDSTVEFSPPFGLRASSDLAPPHDRAANPGAGLPIERRSASGDNPNDNDWTLNGAPDVAHLLALPRAKDLLREISKLPTSSERAEIKNATLLACLSAQGAYQTMREPQSPAVHLAALRHFLQGYCAGIDRNSPEVVNARASAELDQAVLEDELEIGRANILDQKIYAQEQPDEAVTREWLDSLLQARNPLTARALSHLATDQSGPFYSLLRDHSLGTWDAGRGYQLSEAVAAIIACRNGPLCAPDRAYTMTACMERGNCATGASLLDIRRDSMSPQDWRIAEAIVASLQARRRAGRDGG
ncbi:MAG: hypothetical protein U1F26_12740 [Lysobacterales bacterium]